MILLILIIITSYLLNLVLPWWSVAIPGLILGFQFKPEPVVAFGTGFLALFLLWGGQALIIDIGNMGILSERIAEMLGVGAPWLVIVVTAIMGGLVSGFATLTGALVKRANQDLGE